MQDWQQITIESPTGAQLNAYMMEPAGDPRALVQINHGLADHAARYREFAQFLAARQFAVVAHDHRGHGLTVAEAGIGQFAHTRGLDAVLSDILAVVSFLRERHPSPPLVCFGHSMGAILAMNFAIRNPAAIDALAVWNTNIQRSPLLWLFRQLLRIEIALKGSDVPSNLAKKLAFEAWNRHFAPNRTEFDWLSRDQREVDAYIADPLCGFAASTGMWLDVLQAVKAAANKGNQRKLPDELPIQLVGGSDDPSADFGNSMSALEQSLRLAGCKSVQCTIYPDNRHEALKELDREMVMANFVVWLNRVLKVQGG